jgi:hypothetical protein
MAAGKGGAEFGHGFAPPAHDSGRPAVVRNRVGDGEVIYIAAEAFGEYHRNFNPFLGELLLAQVDRLLPDPIVKASTPAQVEMVVLRKGDDLIVHLVNHSGREQLAGHWYPVFTYMPEIRGVECRIRLAGRGMDVLSVPSGQQMEWHEDAGYAVVRVPSLEIMSSLTVPGYFG